MIAVVEPPWEYIPRGRPTIEEHPGPTILKQHPNIPSENILLQRLQNVNISATEENNEFWCIREIYEELTTSDSNKTVYNGKHVGQVSEANRKDANGAKSKDNIKDGRSYRNALKHSNFMSDHLINSEEELYVNKHTAVWTKGLSDETSMLSRLCFTCETQIKFAFFCNKSFVSHSRSENDDKEALNAICVIDQNSIHVYCDNGEDFIANLQFPVSHVWSTGFGILLEKIASNIVIQNQSISMPRLFSMSHPLDEVCPVLYKSAANTISYFIESYLSVIFCDENSNLVLLYDSKIGKHFVAQLRKATAEEIQYIGAQNDVTIAGSVSAYMKSNNTGCSTSNIPPTGSQCSFSQNSLKFAATGKGNSIHLGRTSLGTTNYTNHISKFLNSGHSIYGTATNINRSTNNTTLSNLHSTIGQHFTSMQNLRKCGKSQPSKPIFPELCLEHIWLENFFGSARDYLEMSTKAFIHEDIVGQTYICYLLPRSCKLQMVCLKNYKFLDVYLDAQPQSLPAKDAVPINRMNMLAVLDPNGSIVLYSGVSLVSKIYIPNNIVSNKANSRISGILVSASNSTIDKKSPNTSFPRRSSLLPTSQKTADATFEDELHLLSPVQPLQSQFASKTADICSSVRDAAGNRFTLVYNSGRMIRITLPVMNATKLVERCLNALRYILNKQQYIQFITKWYCARNPPGSPDYSTEQEWYIFSGVLLDLMGYSSVVHDTSLQGIGNSTSQSFHAEEPKKRKKHEINSGTDADWEFMLSVVDKDADKSQLNQTFQCSGEINTNACLFHMIPAVFHCLHLLYEDFKLDESMQQHLQMLSKFLHQLAIDMQLNSYMLHYSLDFPLLVKNSTKSCNLTEEHGSQMLYKELLQVPAIGIYKQLDHIICNRNVLSYNYIDGVNNLSRNVLQVISVALYGYSKLKKWIHPLEFNDCVASFYPRRPKRFISTHVSRSKQVLQLLVQLQITRKDIEHLPLAIHLIIAESLEKSRVNPPLGCSVATYELILRSELVQHAKLESEKLADRKTNMSQKKLSAEDEDSLTLRCTSSKTDNTQLEKSKSNDDGMRNIDTKLLNLRFRDDMRIMEVRRLLSSSEPVLIDIAQSPGVSDHEFIEEQEKQLLKLCVRTMTLPLGRGMFTLRTSVPTPTESMPIPKLCLTGKEPVKGATIEMQQIEFPANMSLWPTFHNGVAAGLKIYPTGHDVDSTWIVYNKPKGQSDMSTEHAGFLMAVGLNGHLKKLSFMSIYEYLIKCDEMISVGLLLGLAATHRGTMDNTTTKLLSVHIEALLPATALELDIPQNIQVASVMGIGLLYQGTAKRHIAEVLLQEIGRPPGPEMENSIERESYALTAGLALGLVTLGQGETPAGLRDLQVPDTLHYYMVGSNKRNLTGSQKEKYKLPSFQVREGDHVNIDVTAPGATLALGLMFLNTSNTAVAEWMKPPNTHFQLSLIRPDLLLLRTIAHGLIMWPDIQASEDWLTNQLPAILRFDMDRDVSDTIYDNVDHEALTQAYCNVMAGSAFSIGLKYAGSEDPIAFKTLFSLIELFMGFYTGYVGIYARRVTVENSLMVVLLALSLVFAGSGNLKILRLIRYLRSRIGFLYTQVNYGSHMAIHMALGFLFLGAGRFTISRRPEAIAALVCALFPKFPSYSNDNRYHLQALRHLYVLAVEPRLFLPRDIDTKKLCLCQIAVLEIGSKNLRTLAMAPCLLPDLSTLQKVVINDPNYWPVSFERGRNWNQLLIALENSKCIDIKKRSGCLSLLEDPDRLKSLFAQTLTTEQSICWEIDPKTLQRFSKDSYVLEFSDRFLQIDGILTTNDELKWRQHLSMLFYNAVVKDKMHVLPIYLALYNHVLRVKVENINFNDIWQIKLVNSYLERQHSDYSLISKELVSSLLEQTRISFDGIIKRLAVPLRQFVSTAQFQAYMINGINQQDLQLFLAVLIFYDLSPNILNILVKEPTNYMGYLEAFQQAHIDTSTAFCLFKILQTTSV